LVAENFASLSGLRIGLITNHSGIDSSGRGTLELIHNAPGVKLAAIFSPEHGLTGKEDDIVYSSVEPTTGLPLYSLYSYNKRPTEKMLDGLDALVFDIQDVGVRKRNYWYDETGLQWVNPSPNLHSLTEAILYSGVGLVEGANVSVGRGTDTPFELLGAPWINGMELAVYLNSRRIRGVQFIPVDFTPGDSLFKNRLCHGVRIILSDRNALDSPALGIEIASALYRLYPNDFQIDKILDLIGSHQVLNAIKDGRDPNSIALQWQAQLEQFRNLRSKYLLY